MSTPIRWVLDFAEQNSRSYLVTCYRQSRTTHIRAAAAISCSIRRIPPALVFRKKVTRITVCKECVQSYLRLLRVAHFALGRVSDGCSGILNRS